MKEEIKNLPFKVGDKATGFKISDFKEDQDKDSLERSETIINIEHDGGTYYYITTDLTEKNAAKIEKENAGKPEEEQMETRWYINLENAEIRVVNEIAKKVDLSVIGGKIEGDFIVFEHAEIPLSLIKSLTPFIREVQNKDIEEIIAVEDEISVIVAGVEFTPSMLKAILNV